MAQQASFLLQMIIFYTPEHLPQASVCTGPARRARMLALAHPLLPTSPGCYQGSTILPLGGKGLTASILSGKEDRTKAQTFPKLQKPCLEKERNQTKSINPGQEMRGKTSCFKKLDQGKVTRNFCHYFSLKMRFIDLISVFLGGGGVLR